MPIKLLLLFGAGGHAKVAYEAVRLAQPDLFIEVFDDEARLLGHPFLDVCVSLSPPCLSDGQFIHVAIGDNSARKRVAQSLIEKGARLYTVRHPAAATSSSAAIQSGCLIAASAIVGPEGHLGMGAIVNHAAIVDHECHVGNWSHIAPGAVLGGRVTVGEGVLIGAGAVVLPGTRIGDWVVVGGGAVVTRDVPAGEVVVGMPARSMQR